MMLPTNQCESIASLYTHTLVYPPPTSTHTFEHFICYSSNRSTHTHIHTFLGIILQCVVFDGVKYIYVLWAPYHIEPYKLWYRVSSLTKYGLYLSCALFFFFTFLVCCFFFVVFPNKSLFRLGSKISLGTILIRIIFSFTHSVHIRIVRWLYYIPFHAIGICVHYQFFWR